MTPRLYQLGRRQDAMDRTRQRIVRAAAALLLTRANPGEFSVDAVARRARVARRTVYLRFGSRRGLLEAVFDSLAVKGGVPRLAQAFQEEDPRKALRRLIATFGHFWTIARSAIRRIRGLAALDKELNVAIEARNERRRQGLGVVLQRVSGLSPAAETDVVNVLQALTSFEMFDILAGPTRLPDDVVPTVQRLAEAVVADATGRPHTR